MLQGQLDKGKIDAYDLLAMQPSRSEDGDSRTLTGASAGYHDNFAVQREISNYHVNFVVLSRTPNLFVKYLCRGDGASKFPM